MQEIIEKYGSLSEYFIEAKKSLVSLDEKKKQLNLLKGKKTTFSDNEKKLTTTKEKLIDKTINDRKKELVDVFNKKLVEFDQALKKAKQEKGKERQKILKEKVTYGTKIENENIVFLKNNFNNIIKENKLSGILSFDFYYDIFAPSKVTEYIKGGLIFVLCFVGVPTLICLIFQRKMTFWMIVMTFVITTFIFGIIYLLLSHIGKCDKNILDELREIRKDIKENKKKIVKITKEITSEKEEGNAAYTKIDRTIETINLSIKELKEKQEKSLENFENSTKNVIINEIEKESKKDFLANEKELKKATNEFEKVEKEYEILKSQIENDFVNVIGKENYTEKTIEKLIKITTEDSAINLEKALILAKK